MPTGGRKFLKDEILGENFLEILVSHINKYIAILIFTADVVNSYKL